MKQGKEGHPDRALKVQALSLSHWKPCTLPFAPGTNVLWVDTDILYAMFLNIRPSNLSMNTVSMCVRVSVCVCASPQDPPSPLSWCWDPKHRHYHT